MAEQAVVSSRQEFQRLDKELANALAAASSCACWAPSSRRWPSSSRRSQRSSGCSVRPTRAGRKRAQLAELARNIRMLQRRVTELGDVPEALARADAAARGLHERLELVERTAEEERTVWVRERQYAETKRTELLKQYEEVKEQRDQIVKLGPEGTCPTCKRPLGPEYASVLALLDAQLEVITGDGKYFRQRLEQLAQPPPSCWMRRPSETACSRKTAAPVLGRGSCGRRSRNAIAPARSSRARGGGRATSSASSPRGRRLRRGATRRGACRAREARAGGARSRRAGGARPARGAPRAGGGAGRAAAVDRRAPRAGAHRGRPRRRLLGRRVPAGQGSLRSGRRCPARGRARGRRGARRAEPRRRRSGGGEATGGAERAQRERQIAVLKARQRLHNELDRAFSDLRAS